MEVRVNWVAKNTKARYRVEAADLESAVKFMSARDNNEWGVTDYDMQANWKPDAQDNVSAVTIDAKYTITMPRWPAYRSQPQKCKDEWDTMWVALRKHEDGHRERFEQYVSKLKSKLEALATATGRNVEEIVKQVISENASEQEKYDTSTDHGKSRGVELTITPECRSKQKSE